MDFDQFIIKLRSVLTPLPGFEENSTHFMVRCPNCESTRDPNKHGHLYINKLKTNNAWDCKKCPIQGYNLTLKILESLGVNDNEIREYVTLNHKIKHTHIVNVDERNQKLNYTVNTPTKEYEKHKLSVISNRLLHDLNNIEDITMYRIITSIYSFIESNNIPFDSFTDREKSQISVLDTDYIGFLSFYGNIASFRKVSNNAKLPRYVTFTFNKELKRSFMYIPAITIDPLAENPIINVAEGAIDIISIHLNNSEFCDNNNIYGAASSVSGVRRAVKSLLSLSGYFGGTINIYHDNEELVNKISSFDFSKTIKMMHDFGQDFKVNGIVNLSGKDFGDPSENITIGKANLNRLL